MQYTYQNQFFFQDLTGFFQPSATAKAELLLELDDLAETLEKLKTILRDMANHWSICQKDANYQPADKIARKLSALLKLPHRQDDLLEFQTIADSIRRFGLKEVIVLGTGGSSLGSQALYEMARELEKNEKLSGKYFPKLQILINFDPFAFSDMIKTIDWQTTGLIAISKSGDTLETILQTLYVLPIMEKALGFNRMQKHFWVVSCPGENALNKIADHYGAKKLEHDIWLSGRYSVLSVVGLLPVMIAGLSGQKVRHGAYQMLQDSLNIDVMKNPTALSAAAIYHLEQKKSMKAVVMLSYADRLSTLCRWFRQLWAESLGKDGMGSVPIFATGPVDQHSQLELWLGGPKNKIFTILTNAEKIGLPPPPTELLALHQDLQQYHDISLEDMMVACARGMAAVLQQYHLPVRQIHVHRLAESEFGALLMHLMIETLLVGFLRGGFDPFDQPEVEQGKKLIRTELQKLRR